MNIKELKESGRIVFECVSGSHLYNLNTPKSDVDIRGIYVNPTEEYLGLSEPSGQISDEKNDTTYYSLKRFFELAQTANPNIIELLWVPENCFKIKTPLMQKMMDNRDLFITKKCFHTHSGYAYAQIKKAQGSNKKVHNPMPEEMPKKEDFCWVILRKHMNYDWLADDAPSAPCRPLSLKESNIDLSKCHVAAVEHTDHIYRLYIYDDMPNCKGVFRGDDMLVCESIPKQDEFLRFIGLLIYNQEGHQKALKDWHSYWDWVQNRNNERWIDQEKGLLNYDQKNMMHCLRLLISGEHILTHGCPIVRFEGEQRDYLMKIRAGEFKYEELMAEVERRMVVLEELYKTSTIPHSANMKKIEALYRELANWEEH